MLTLVVVEQDGRARAALARAGTADTVVGQLARPVLVVPASTAVREVDARLVEHAELRAVVVAGSSPVLLDRGRWAALVAERLSHDPGRRGDLIASDLGGAAALVLPEGTPVQDAAAAVLTRPADQRNDDVLVVDGAGTPTGCVATADVFERLARRYAHQSLHDPLTGLPNRLAFLQALHEATARGDDVVLLYVDLDRFKEVNDEHGHAAGDQVLVAVADRLRAVAREEDVVARLGGDEFAVLARGPLPVHASRSLAQRVVEQAAVPVVLAADPGSGRPGGREVAVGASVGIAHADGAALTASVDGAAADVLLGRADSAMYRAKARGRGRAVLARQEEAAEQPPLRAGLEDRLRAAVEADAVELHVQPVVALPSGRTVAVEALARWRDGERGWVPPSAFVPVAERTGLVVELGRQLLDRACAMASAWRAAGQDVGVSVNVSPHQLAERDYVDQVAASLSRHGLPGRALALEVTESAVLRDVDLAADRLASVRELGVQVALDDFGTGSSSLALLRRLPVDVVKVDKSFVDRVSTDARDAVLVRLLVDASHALGFVVCAEGVEDLGQARQLVALGVDRAQGWAFAPALPVQGAALGPGHLPEVEVDMAQPPPLPLGSSEEVSVVVAPDETVAYVSPGVVESLGRTSAELVGSPVVASVHPDDVLALRGDSGVPHTVRVRRRDGSWAWWRVQGHPSRGHGPSLWIGRDVSGPVGAERALREREDLFRVAFDASPVGMGLTTLEGRYLLVNTAYAVLVGEAPEALVGRTVAEFTHPDDVAADAQNLEQLAGGGGVLQVVGKRVLRADGEVVPVEVRAHLLRDDEGAPLYVLAHVLPAGAAR